MKIIAAFPGAGKSFLSNKHPHISDSDSSHFDKRYFPTNYLDHIQALYDRGVCTFVSSHSLVREGLVKRNLPFLLAYPDHACRDEYMERYSQRGSPVAFLELLYNNWDTWLDECVAQKGCEHLVLGPGVFLEDAIGWGFYLK